jgi:hypothetical protein
MKSLFKLAIFFLLAHALVRFAVPYWHHHQFESALKARIFDWRESSDETILTEVFTLAEENSVPLEREQVVLRRQNDRMFLDIAYTRRIELVPTVVRPWEFEMSLSGVVLPGSAR